MRVGVFDSGVGGLSVVKSLLEHNLFSHIVYYGDTARVPYGIKDPSTIRRYAIEAVEFFKNFELDLIIVACNTVSAYALDAMRGATSVKVVGVVEAGVLAVQNAMPDRAKRILILGTPATVSSKAYEVALGKLGYNNLKSIATALFVPLVEEGIYDGVIVEAVFEHYFGNLERPDAIILGCTHFPLLAGAMRDYFGDEVLLIHSGDAIVEQLKKECDLVGQQEGSTIEYFASENPQKLQAVAKEWLKA